MNDYYKALLHNASQGLCIITHKDVYKFVTTNPDFTQGETIIQDEDNDEVIRLFNMWSKRVEEIPVIQILDYRLKDKSSFANIKESDDYIQKDVAFLTAKIDGYLKNNSVLSANEIYDLMLNTTFVDIYNINKENSILNFIADTNFCFSVEDITSPTLEGDVKVNFTASFIKYIKVKIQDIINELLELKNQSDDAEDSDDIDVIIEMYKDCENDLDFSQCNSFNDYIRSWPPLLLPIPLPLEHYLIHGIPGINNSDNTSQNDVYVEFMNIIDSDVLSNDELQTLLDELNELQPSSYDELNEVSELYDPKSDLTLFKNYILAKIK